MGEERRKKDKKWEERDTETPKEIESMLTTVMYHSPLLCFLARKDLKEKAKEILF